MFLFNFVTSQKKYVENKELKNKKCPLKQCLCYGKLLDYRNLMSEKYVQFIICRYECIFLYLSR